MKESNPRYLQRFILLEDKLKISCIFHICPKFFIWLIRWILLLQEFDLEIRDKKWVEYLVADHLSCLLFAQDDFVIRETFPDKQLFSTRSSLPWYAYIVSYLVTNQLPACCQRQKEISLGVMLSITCGMTPTYGDNVQIKYCEDA